MALTSSSFYDARPVIAPLMTALASLDRMDWETALNQLDALPTRLHRLTPKARQTLRQHPTLVADALARYRHMPEPPETAEDGWSDLQQQQYRTMSMVILGDLIVELIGVGAPVRGTPAEQALAGMDAWPLTEHEHHRTALLDALLDAGARLDVTVTPALDPHVDLKVSPLAYVLMGGFDYENDCEGLPALLAHGATLPNYEAFLALHGERSGGLVMHPWGHGQRQGCLEQMFQAMPATPERVFALFHTSSSFSLNEPIWSSTALTSWVTQGWVDGQIVNPDTGQTLFHEWAAGHHLEATPQDFAQRAQVLLAAGADPLAADAEGTTPLHRLMWNTDADPERLGVLLEQGADLLTPDQGGLTPHGIAVHQMATYADSLSSSAHLTFGQVIAEGRRADLAQRPAAPARRSRRRT